MHNSAFGYKNITIEKFFLIIVPLLFEQTIE